MPRTLCTLALLLGASGCGFYFEAQEPSVCRTLHNQTINAGPPGTLSYSQTYSYDFGKELISVGGSKAKTTIQVVSVTMDLVSGAPNLDFIQSGQVTVIDPTGVLPEARVLDYKRDASAPSAQHELSFGSGQPVDVTRYVSNHRLSAHVQLAGSFPSSTMVVDVKACISTTVRDDYL